MKLNDNIKKNYKDAKDVLINIINRPHKIMQDGDVIDLAKDLGIPIWDVTPSEPANIYNNIKVVSTEPQSRSEISISDLYDELKMPKPELFETLYKRWKELNFICNILGDTVYVESMDKSKFFIINENSFTIKSNNDKGVTLNLFTLQVICDTIDYLLIKNLPDDDEEE
jgi:hypothetical protein